MKWFLTLQESRRNREELERASFPLRVAFRHWILLVVIFTALLLGALTKQGLIFPDRSEIDITLGVLTTGAFLIAYQQWREARYEQSLEKFYDRLELANRRLEKLDNTNTFDMYIFTELDNLEYVIEKYRLDYMSSAHAVRAKRTFYSRCEQEEFREKALYWVGVAGYQPTTVEVVKRICTQMVTS
jgi:hypothetical protein